MAYFVGYRGAQRVADFFARKCHELEIAHELPGWNTVENNRLAWANHDWSRGGEEWSESSEWAQSLIEHVMYAEMSADEDLAVLEIGPGAGRWTEALHLRSSSLGLVDITDRTLALCRERLEDPSDVSYFVNDGRSLASISPNSVDFIWSFDAFVHIAPSDIEAYVSEFARVMRPGARAVIHHAGAGNVDGGWRSSMTASLFADFVRQHGLRLVRQLDRWGPDGRFRVPHAHDTVSVLEQP